MVCLAKSLKALNTVFCREKSLKKTEIGDKVVEELKDIKEEIHFVAAFEKTCKSNIEVEQQITPEIN